MNKSVHYYLPAIIWAVFILTLTSYPCLELPDTGVDMQDKIAHFGVYFIFAFLLSRALWKGGKMSIVRAICLSILYCSFWAIFDELHQSLIPGRNPDVLDGLADIAGVVSVQPLFLRYTIHFSKKETMD